jgi:hypothetical protein
VLCSGRGQFARRHERVPDRPRHSERDRVLTFWPKEKKEHSTIVQYVLCSTAFVMGGPTVVSISLVQPLSPSSSLFRPRTDLTRARENSG